MHLADADKQGIMEVAKTMSDAGRLNLEGLSEAFQAVNQAMPTAEEAAKTFAMISNVTGEANAPF